MVRATAIQKRYAGSPIVVRLVALVALICFGSSCTKMVEIPPADYESLGSEKGVYLLRTYDGKAIETDRFKTTETGFLIESMFEDGKRKSVEPFEIEFTQITHISRQDLNLAPLFIGVTAIGVLVFLGNMMAGRLD